MSAGWRSLLAGILGRFGSPSTAVAVPLPPADAAHTWELEPVETLWALAASETSWELESGETTWPLPASDPTWELPENDTIWKLRAN